MKKSYILVLILIIIVALIILGGYKLNQKFSFFQSSATAQRIYNQGLDAIKQNDLQNAYYNFSKVSQFSSLFEPALFRQGLVASELNDNEAAIKSYETLLDKFPNTIFAKTAIYNLAVAYFNVNNKEQAYANFNVIADRYKDTDYADATNYFLGVLTKETNKNKSAEHFFSYIKAAPNGKYSLFSIEELKTLKENFSDEENLLIGNAYLENGKTEEALEYLNQSKLSDAWASLSLAYKLSGNYSATKSIFEEGLTKYSTNNSDIQKNAIEEYTRFYNGRVNGLKAAKTLCDQSKCKLNDYIMYNLITYSDNKTQNEYYNRIYTEFPEGDYAPDALFNSMFDDYTNKKYDNAIIKAKKHLSLYEDKKSAPTVMYWLAKTYEKKNNISEAKNLYSKVYTKHKESYYAYLAAAKLNKINTPFITTIADNLPTDKINIDLPILQSNLPLNSAQKIDELLSLNDFKIFEYADFDNDIMKSWVAYYENNDTKASVVAEKTINNAKVKPQISDDIYKLSYPIAYAELINQNAKKYNISPYLIISLIRKESRFNTEAKSSVGATGLMQIMPDTAMFIAQKNNIRHTPSLLTEPEYNIMLSSSYYNYIKKNYFSNDLFVIASYNGGYGSVSKWIKRFGTSDLEEFVEKIPYPETKDYVKQVYKNYWMYNCIYNSSKIR